MGRAKGVLPVLGPRVARIQDQGQVSTHPHLLQGRAEQDDARATPCSQDRQGDRRGGWPCPQWGLPNSGAVPIPPCSGIEAVPGRPLHHSRSRDGPLCKFWGSAPQTWPRRALSTSCWASETTQVPRAPTACQNKEARPACVPLPRTRSTPSSKSLVPVSGDSTQKT